MRPRQKSASATKEAAKPPPTRACVVCRVDKPLPELLRLSFHKGEVGLGKGDKGRGAHVCANSACISLLSARNLSHAFKEPTTIDVASFVATLHAVAETKVLEAVGLARRQGALAFGVDELDKTPAASVGGLTLLAADLSERALKHAPQGSVFVEGNKLGHAAGMGYLGAVRLAPGPLSVEAAYWISLWYESRALGPESRPRGALAGEGRVAAVATPVQS